MQRALLALILATVGLRIVAACSGSDKSSELPDAVPSANNNPEPGGPSGQSPSAPGATSSPSPNAKGYVNSAAAPTPAPGTASPASGTGASNSPPPDAPDSSLPEVDGAIPPFDVAAPPLVFDAQPGKFTCGTQQCNAATDYCQMGGAIQCVPLPSNCLSSPSCACVESATGASNCFGNNGALTVTGQ
jgi:hypothetical protein